MSTKPSEPDRFALHYDQGMLRSAFRSLFWSIISEKKKSGSFSLASLVALLPRGDKGKVSRWFNGDPNWTVNTIGTLANSLNVDIRIQAVDRKTGVIYTPAGIQNVPTIEYVRTEPATRVEQTRFATPIIRRLPLGASVTAADAA
jgi:hypothetical protein